MEFTATQVVDMHLILLNSIKQWSTKRWKDLYISAYRSKSAKKDQESAW
jgi:hypothetical protein